MEREAASPPLRVRLLTTAEARELLVPRGSRGGSEVGAEGGSAQDISARGISGPSIAAPDGLLALVGFGERPSVLHEAAGDPRLAWIPLAEIGPSEPCWEAWFGTGAVEVSEIEGVVLARDGATAFGHLRVDEGEAGGLEAATLEGYRRIFAALQETAYPHLLRAWHVVADIHEPLGELDRYKAFCRARAEALVRQHAETEARLPAASAIGGRVPGLAIHFLASRTPGRQVENPRQVSAFHYPREYGPRSPAFSRAQLLPAAGAEDEGGANRGNGTGGTLLISGTASIVGHRSLHEDDLRAQFSETLANIEALLAGAGAPGEPMRPAAVRVYVRRPEWAAELRALLAERLGTGTPAVVLEAEICRPELLVEIEGVAHASNPA